MSTYVRVLNTLLLLLAVACGDDNSNTAQSDAAQSDAAREAGPTDAATSDAKLDAEPETPDGDVGLDAGQDAGACQAEPPVAPQEQRCSEEDVACFFAADTEEEQQACAEQSETGADCYACVLLGGAACAYENGCDKEWNELVCCQARECQNAPFEPCPACDEQAEARQACERNVGVTCLSAGTECFPPL